MWEDKSEKIRGQSEKISECQAIGSGGSSRVMDMDVSTLKK